MPLDLEKVNFSRVASDNAVVTSMTMSSSFLVPWAMVWVVLLRALLVEAGLLPRTCRRCGRAVERGQLGEAICSCDV
jgi:hypothetical protein